MNPDACRRPLKATDPAFETRFASLILTCTRFWGRSTRHRRRPTMTTAPRCEEAKGVCLLASMVTPMRGIRKRHWRNAVHALGCSLQALWLTFC